MKQQELIDFKNHVESISLEEGFRLELFCSLYASEHVRHAIDPKPSKLFITGELESGDEASVLRAIGLLQSLLVRKQTNMKALALLLLDDKYVLFLTHCSRAAPVTHHSLIFQ